jgi:hypothetical protein
MAACLLAALPFSALAMTLDDLVPGKTVVGPECSVKDMKGKVVYVELWGTR